MQDWIAIRTRILISGNTLPPTLAVWRAAALCGCLDVVAGGRLSAPRAITVPVNCAGQAGVQRGADLRAGRRLPRDLALLQPDPLLVPVARSVAATPTAFRVGHTGGHAAVDLARSLQSCNCVWHCVAQQVPSYSSVVASHNDKLGTMSDNSGVSEHTLSLWIGMTWRFVLLGTTLPTVAVQAV